MKNNADLMPISKFIKILVIVVFCLGAIYLITEKLVKKDTTSNEETAVSYNEVIVGNSMSQKEAKYYVLFYDPSTDIASYLDSWQSSYIEAKKATKLYFVDLNKTINEKFISSESNPNATVSSELKLKNGTLIVIENGKITNYVENIQEIYQLLK